MSSLAQVPDFHHPYKPYKIQEDLMLALYTCLEQSKVGIFESPTGTGKSLSLICGSLSWLRSHKKSAFEDDDHVATSENEPDWIEEHARQQRRRLILDNRKELEARLAAVRKEDERIRKQHADGQPHPKRRKINSDVDDKVTEDEFMLDEYCSDDEQRKSNTAAMPNELGLSAETQALMDSLDTSRNHRSSDGLDGEDEVKIYFCSRTHSQLTQFVGELRRVEMPSPYPMDTENHVEYPMEPFKQLSLSSRKNLCINEKVLRLQNPTAINEKCLDLQSSKTPQDQKCQYMPTQDNKVHALDFQHHALAKVRDIEDLGAIGKKIGICPYYASRPAIKPAEIVTLPYPMLLQSSAREALGINLKDNIIIIDEAHNLMDAILGLYTVDISLAQLQLARDQLATYLQKFRNRLKGKNRVYVTQVVRIIDSLRECLIRSEERLPTGGVINQSDLLAGRGVDQINLYKLLGYLQESRLARKVHGYIQSQSEQGGESIDSRTAPVLNILGDFIMALTNPAAEGRFFSIIGHSTSERKLKYLLLDPSEHFREIVESARSVILVGGTMSPMDDYIHQLFPYLASDRISTLSCGHVIPSSNLFVSSLSSTLNGTPLDFTFSNRTSRAMLLALGETLIELLTLTPDGAVVFFPSYAYLESVLTDWRTNTTTTPSILSRLQRVKQVFIDSPTNKPAATPTHKASQQQQGAENVLAAYTAAITDGHTSRGSVSQSPQTSDKSKGRGAVLLSVLGGRLSEGINFSDALGRLVVVVGLPYPNPHAPEFKARMAYIEARAAARTPYVKGAASREFADNLCMRAVNQAIGRAVRHKDDWAAILLLDRRYSQRRIVDKLPGWIRGSMVDGNGGSGSGQVKRQLQGFYERLNSKQ